MKKLINVVLLLSLMMMVAGGVVLAQEPDPTEEATAEPTEEVTAEPTEEATAEPTEEATAEPTEEATAEPTEEATHRLTNRRRDIHLRRAGFEPVGIRGVCRVESDRGKNREGEYEVFRFWDHYS